MTQLANILDNELQTSHKVSKAQIVCLIFHLSKIEIHVPLDNYKHCFKIELGV